MSLLRCGTRTVDLSRPRVMGILNITPDSFSDGGRYFSLQEAVDRAGAMCAEGADLIDVGGESTRPGAAPVSAAEEIDRVIPVVQAVSQGVPLPVSVDTSKAEVMREAARCGAGMINDVRALRGPGALQAAAECDLPICLMHMLGEPGTMQQAPTYTDVVAEVATFLSERVACCKQFGIGSERLILDPGFGFGKQLEHNLVLLRGLRAFRGLGLPLLVGLSRKSMIGTLLDGAPVEERLVGSVAAALIAAERGAAILRVHDVRPTVEALRVLAAVAEGSG